MSHDDDRRRRLGSLVKGLRKVRDLTQEQLAERSDLAPDTIRRLEHGDFSPSLTTLGKLCAGLKLSLSGLFVSLELTDEREADLDEFVMALRARPDCPVRVLLALVQAWPEDEGS